MTRPNPGCFSWFAKDRIALLFQGQRGGVEQKKAVGVEQPPHSLNSFVFYGLSLVIRLPCVTIQKNQGKTIATPPERGVPTGPV